MNSLPHPFMTFLCEVDIPAPALAAFFFLSSHLRSPLYIFRFIHTKQHKTKSTFFCILKICNATRNEQARFNENLTDLKKKK